MRILLSTIGTRGDVQPLVALAMQLKALGQQVQVCVPPDFKAWIEGLGIAVTPIGPELRSTAKASPPVSPSTPEERRRLAEASVAAQFETIQRAAQGCDVIVGATALQIAAPSVAEKMGIPYIFAAYCPAVLPSRHHAPPVFGMLGDTPAHNSADCAGLWERDAQRFNLFAPALNAHRAAIGLSPVVDVRSHIFTEHPWLAADPALAPWPEPDDGIVFQTGAWLLADERPLPAEVEAFLEAGEAPVLMSFGSNRAPEDASGVMAQTARALGKRAIVSQGWAELFAGEGGDGLLTIGEVNFQALFPRAAAVVHHGGAGTTTLAALAGVPQVIVPQMYDQFYFAERIDTLGIGRAHLSSTPVVNSLANAVEAALQPDVAARARAMAGAVRRDGTRLAAERLMKAGG